MLKKLNGAHVVHHKNTSDMSCIDMKAMGEIIIPMSMHIGAPCNPLVKANDEVKVGQIIGENQDSFICAPIHSSVSGKVKSIVDFIQSNGQTCKAVVIENDGLYQVSESVKPPIINSKEDLIKAIYNSGIVGIGGAGFPSHVKLSPKTPIDTLIVNAAECEPYITVDNRECLDNSDDVIFAIKQIQKYLNIKNACIGIEGNKPKAIAHLKEKTANEEGISVVQLEAKYPQGAEKVLIYCATGRTVQEGKLPSDVGVIVFNVSTLGKMANYIKTGMPLTTKNLTIDGDAIAKPQNITVPIGTAIKEIAEFCGGYKNEPKKIIMGGPMMGSAMQNDEFPVIKNTNALLFFTQAQTKEVEPSNCIRCARCIKTCPYKLMPVNYERALERNDVDALIEQKVMMCMECGCCEFICPANRKLVSTNKLGKQLIRKANSK